VIYEIRCETWYCSDDVTWHQQQQHMSQRILEKQQSIEIWDENETDETSW